MFIRLVEVVATMGVGAKNREELQNWLRQIETTPAEREAIEKNVLVCRLDLYTMPDKAKLLLSFQHHRCRRLLLECMHQGMVGEKKGSEAIGYLEEELVEWLGTVVPQVV